MAFQYTRLQSFRGADCDTDQCLVVPKVKKNFSVSKQAAHKLYVDRFNVIYLNELEIRKEYQIRVS